ILTLLERAGAFEHHVDTQLSPRELRRIAGAQRLELPPGNVELAVVDRHRLLIAAVDGVEAQQVGQVLGVDEIVDRDELEPGLLDQQLEDDPADSSEPVDCSFRAHAGGLRVSVDVVRRLVVRAAVFSAIVRRMSSNDSANFSMPSSSSRSVTSERSIPTAASSRMTASASSSPFSSVAAALPRSAN